MARGDQKRKAAHRHAAAEAEQSLASYQHRVAKLTVENRELCERLAAQERAAKQTERRLRAERDEGVAPQVVALQMQLDAAKRKHREHIDRVAAAVKGVVEKRPESAFAIDLADIAVAIGERWGAVADGAVGMNRYTRRRPAGEVQGRVEALEGLSSPRRRQ